MNKEQRKFAVNAIRETAGRKSAVIMQERDKAKEALEAASHPADLYVAELDKNDKERRVFMDKVMANLRGRSLGHIWNTNIEVDLVEDTRVRPSDCVETPMLKKLKKAYYDEIDRLDKVCQDRLSNINSRANALITQIWLSDMPQELVELLKAFEAEEF